MESSKLFVVCWVAVACAMASTASADVVTYWDDVLINVIRADTTQLGPTKVARNMAMVHAAVYDAVNSVERGVPPL
jgi:glutathionyl-hydroquinone reductase